MGMFDFDLFSDLPVPSFLYCDALNRRGRPEIAACSRVNCLRFVKRSKFYWTAAMCVAVMGVNTRTSACPCGRAGATIAHWEREVQQRALWATEREREKKKKRINI